MADPGKMMALESMLGDVDGGGNPFASDTVQCGACRSQIDRETGRPAGEVTPRNVEALHRYMAGGAEAELGGVQLIDV